MSSLQQVLNVHPAVGKHVFKYLLNTNATFRLAATPNARLHSYFGYLQDSLAMDNAEPAFQLSLPIHYPRINAESSKNMTFDEYVDRHFVTNNKNGSDLSVPYIIFILGKGKSVLGYFQFPEISDNIPSLHQSDKSNKSKPRAAGQLIAMMEYSCVYWNQSKGLPFIKYDKSSDCQILPLTVQSLTKYHSLLGGKINAWHNKLVTNFDNSIENNGFNDINIGYMICNNVIWNDFWQNNKQFSLKEQLLNVNGNNCNKLTFFRRYDNRLIDINYIYEHFDLTSQNIQTKYDLPKKSDLLRLNYQLSNINIYLNNKFENINDKFIVQPLLSQFKDYVKFAQIDTTDNDTIDAIDKKNRKLKSKENEYDKEIKRLIKQAHREDPSLWLGIDTQGKILTQSDIEEKIVELNPQLKTHYTFRKRYENNETNNVYKKKRNKKEKKYVGDNDDDDDQALSDWHKIMKNGQSKPTQQDNRQFSDSKASV